MEIANLDSATIRLATSKDAQQILRLLQESPFAHIHADWHVPGDWLGTPGFVVSEHLTGAGAMSSFGLEALNLMACLAVAADPYPAAWVRIAAIRQTTFAQEVLAEMLEAVLPFLRETAVTALGWLAVESWPGEILPALGFHRENWITTFIKEGVDSPPIKDSGVEIRPVSVNDMETLAAIEAAAYEPLWRHSAGGLRLAYKQSFCFDVALVNEQIVGFQYSTSNHYGLGAHLVRITVHPDLQGLGVGSALMAAAMERYRRRGIKRVSLNTQLDNIASHRLYEKFGFYRTGEQMPVWVMNIGRG
ncbi:MAG: GNAT family N-acetyltransferase [Candidatus Promineifilaceae bacterium]